MNLVWVDFYNEEDFFICTKQVPAGELQIGDKIKFVDNKNKIKQYIIQDKELQITEEEIILKIFLKEVE